MIFFVGLFYLVPLSVGITLGLIHGKRSAIERVAMKAEFWRGVLKGFAIVFLFSTFITWVFFNGRLSADWEIARYLLIVTTYTAAICWVIYAGVFWIGRSATNAIR